MYTKSLGLLAALMMLWMTPLAAQDTFTVSSTGSLVARVAEKALHAAYAELDIDVQFKRFPPKEVLQMSNTGKVDAELTRIAGIEKEFPNLVMVPVPVIQVKHSAFTRGETLQLAGWESLRPYKIGIRRGIILHDRKTQGMQRLFADTNEQLFRLLEQGRVEVVASNALVGGILIHKLQLTGITMVEPPLSTSDLYHYVHKKHTQLVPKLTQVLKAMTADGRLDAIRKQTIAELRK